MVKKFLVQYFEACKQEGYSPMQDPLSTFYEALSVGLNEPDNTNDFLQFSPENTGQYGKSVSWSYNWSWLLLQANYIDNRILLFAAPDFDSFTDQRAFLA